MSIGSKRAPLAQSTIRDIADLAMLSLPTEPSKELSSPRPTSHTPESQSSRLSAVQDGLETQDAKVDSWKTPGNITLSMVPSLPATTHTPQEAPKEMDNATRTEWIDSPTNPRLMVQVEECGIQTSLDRTQSSRMPSMTVHSLLQSKLRDNLSSTALES